MSKKKHHRNAAVTSETQQAPAIDSPAIAAAPAPIATGEGTPLMTEVESFLVARDELAKKLADEIAATEQKLAELKRTAALLFPASSAAVIKEKEKKAKKSKAKAENHAEPTPSPLATDVSSADAA